jgi:hypothetical protein
MIIAHPGMIDSDDMLTQKAFLVTLLAVVLILGTGGCLHFIKWPLQVGEGIICHHNQKTAEREGQEKKRSWKRRFELGSTQSFIITMFKKLTKKGERDSWFCLHIISRRSP